MEQRFPFALCDCCHRTRTSWVINYAKDDYAIWRRTCPYCMSPAEHDQMMIMVRTHVRQRVIYKFGEGRRFA